MSDRLEQDDEQPDQWHTDCTSKLSGDEMVALARGMSTDTMNVLFGDEQHDKLAATTGCGPCAVEITVQAMSMSIARVVATAVGEAGSGEDDQATAYQMMRYGIAELRDTVVQKVLTTRQAHNLADELKKIDSLEEPGVSTVPISGFGDARDVLRGLDKAQCVVITRPIPDEVDADTVDIQMALQVGFSVLKGVDLVMMKGPDQQVNKQLEKLVSVFAVREKGMDIKDVIKNAMEQVLKLHEEKRDDD